MKRVTIDSSVIVSAFVETETRYKEGAKIWEQVLSGEYHSIIPLTVLVEVVSAVRRRTGSVKLALELKSYLLAMSNLSFVEIDQSIAEEAATLAAKLGLRGMDAFVVQIAKEFNAELVSFDHEMMEKVSST